MTKYEWFIVMLTCIVSVICAYEIVTVGADPLEPVAKEYHERATH